MTSLSFHVPGIPAGKGRPRFARATGRAYTPAATIQAERGIGWYAHAAMNGRPLFDGPLHLDLTATYMPPKSLSRRKLEECNLKATRPDLDNIIKLSKDALNGIVWNDDSQVASVAARKLYGDTPGLSVTVSVFRRG